jgi:hypothetical protein
VDRASMLFRDVETVLTQHIYFYRSPVLIAPVTMPKTAESKTTPRDPALLCDVRFFVLGRRPARSAYHSLWCLVIVARGKRAEAWPR